jgi:hypothetical protein
MSEKETWGITPGRRFVQPRRTPDENAQAAWEQILAVKQMLDDMVYAGARLRITRSPVFPKADHKLLMRESFDHWLDRILADAEIVGPEAVDYKCTGGHDRCGSGTSAGPECPYCEPIYV